MHDLFPPPVHGLHSWIFGRACHLRRSGKTAAEAAETLAQIVTTTQLRRPVPRREIEDAVRNAYGQPVFSRPGGGWPVASAPAIDEYNVVTGWPAHMRTPRPEVDFEPQEMPAGEIAMVDLWERSPVRLPDGVPGTMDALAALFADDELVCAGEDDRSCVIRPLQELRDAHTLAKIVPNPQRMAGRRCRENCGPRRYIVIESDRGESLDRQGGFLWFLAQRTHAPLVLVVYSGGKSLHGWFRCDGVPAARLWQWFCGACARGADPRLWLPEQLVRMPDGRRESGELQPIVYFDPEA